MDATSVIAIVNQITEHNGQVAELLDELAEMAQRRVPSLARAASFGKRSSRKDKRKFYPKGTKSCKKRRMSYNRKTKHCNVKKQ